MDDFFKRSVILIELLIATALIGFLILGISSLDTFARFHLITLDRRAQIQNEVSRVLGHMAKNITGQETIGGAIGDINQTPVDITSGIDGDTAVKVYVDTNYNGRRDPATDDKQIAYRYYDDNYEIWYYSNYTDNPTTYDVIANKISTFNPTYSASDNYLRMELTVCWDPDESSGGCGTTIDNPQVIMLTRIKMPAVSVN